jgi:hypothetical protein
MNFLVLFIVGMDNTRHPASAPVVVNAGIDGKPIAGFSQRARQTPPPVPRDRCARAREGCLAGAGSE